MTDTYKLLYGRTTKRSVTPQGRVTRVHQAKYRLFSQTQLDTYSAGTSFSALSGISEMVALAEDPLANCRSINVTDEMLKNPYRYMIDVEWSTETPDSQQPDRELDDPFAEPVEIETDGELVTLPLFKDLDNKAIVNTMGDALTGIEEERSIEIVRFTRNEPRRDSERDRSFRNHVNQNTFSGAAPGKVKMRSIRCVRKFRKRIEYWAYTYEVAYKADGWQSSTLNMGLYRLDGTARKPCVDGNKEPVSDAVPLSVASEQLTPAQIIAGTDLHYIEFRGLYEANFDKLGLPV